MNTGDVYSDRDPVIGWEQNTGPGHKPYKSPNKQLYADMSKNCYNMASDLIDVGGQQDLVDKYNALGGRYHRLSVGLPAEKTEFDMTGRKNE